MEDPKDEDFYVGYFPKAPASLALFLKSKLALLIFCSTLAAAIMAVAQSPFGPAVFEFQEIKSFEGTIFEYPYPTLQVSRPGEHGQEPGSSRYYLVIFGKFGAQEAVAGLDGKQVSLRGELIYRDDQTMIQVEEGSIEVATSGSSHFAGEVHLGKATLRGEIVDSKCFLGVMNPGNLKPHKSCAVRCIAGGIPPVLLVRDQERRARYFLLVSPEGKMVNAEVLDLVAEPVEISGNLVRRDNIYILAADPKSYKRLF